MGDIKIADKIIVEEHPQPVKQEVQKRDIEDIILEVCARDRDGQQRRKWVLIDTRALERLGHTRQSIEKAAAYLSTASLTWSTAEVTFTMISGFLGGPQAGPGGIFSALGIGARKAGDHADQVKQSKITTIDHVYQSTGTILQEESRFIQENDQDYKEDTQTMQRVMQDVQRMIEGWFNS